MMRWYNHKLVAGISVYALGGSFPEACLSAVGSLLPDVLECRGLLRHRALSHWPYPYAAAVLVLSMVSQETGDIYPAAGSYLLYGTLAHLLGDACSKCGIPWQRPYSQPIGLKLYRTGSFSEELFVVAITVFFAILASARGFLAAEYIQLQLSSFLFLIASILQTSVRWVMT